jgi:hypothetical protein
MAFYIDPIDRAQEISEGARANAEAEIRRKASVIPAGEPGKCKQCDEERPRLVNGVCAPCRDKYKLP